MKLNLSLVVIVLLWVSCSGGPDVFVKERRCTGCRDEAGFCLTGNDNTACGLAGVACVACASNQTCGADGTCTAEALPGGGGGGGGNDSADAGDNCSAEARLVYVVDQDRTLSSFDPRLVGSSRSPFSDLGRISCPSTSGAEPFSMAVDRNAVAWIVYDSGELFTVNLRLTPLSCLKTGFMPQYGVARFGMGFVSNEAGSLDEKLFISGSDLGSSLNVTKFGTLSTTAPYAVSVVATLTGAPELSGTGDGKLWAFFANLSPPRVSQLSKQDGTVVTGFTAQQLMGAPRAWAFAVWGGDFFIFLERDTDQSTNVWQMNGQTGALSQVVTSSGRRIVGAGVSTCAPIDIN